MRSGCYGLATKVVSGEKLWRGGRPRFHGGIDAEVLQLARHGRAVDQGRQAGGKDDAAELPLISVERGAAEVVRDRIQLGQPVAAAGAAEQNQKLVADELAATVGEEWWNPFPLCSCHRTSRPDSEGHPDSSNPPWPSG